MLVTNRQIVQNVVERLRGVDRQSQFRTARLDGGQLESILADHTELVWRYFTDRVETIGLGRPAIIATPLATGFSGRDHAYIPVELRTTKYHPIPSAVKSQGIVDTGISMTCIPDKLIAQLGLQPVDRVTIATPIGIREVNAYFVDISIEKLLVSDIRAIGTEFDHVLLGRDSLKGFTVVLEPSGVVTLYETTK